MFIGRLVASTFCIGLMLSTGGIARSQNYPSKPIRMITSDPGSSNDLVARFVAQELTSALGQQVIVDYRGGAGGTIAAELVAHATPDGYTLLSYGSAIWIAPLMQSKASYDAVRDFAPITLAVSSPNILVVNPSMTVTTVKELIALAKANPGQLNYASGITGNSTHLAAELFKAMAGIDIVRVPYKGSGPALVDLVGGQVKIMFPIATAGMPYVRAGKLRALAVTSLKPSELAPGLATVAASGVPGYESIAVTGILAPAKTPAAVINRLNQEIVQGLNRPEIKEKLFNAGASVVASSPAEFAATIKSDISKIGKLIKQAGIRAE